MTPEALARHLRAVRIAIDAHRPDAPEVVDGIADAYVTLDPANDSPYPSANRNAVHYMGCFESVSADDVSRAVGLFTESGCDRFFFWLSPCPQQAEVRSWLKARGLKRFGGTGYPTLIREAEPVPPHDTVLDIKRLDPKSAAAQINAIGEAYGDQTGWAEFVVRSSADPCFDHYGAFRDGRLVGAAGLYRQDDIGYLGWAGVAGPYRGQGGQSALITARVNRGAEIGCKWVCSETLYNLKTSLNNLKRKGFQVLYDKEVYVWKSK